MEGIDEVSFSFGLIKSGVGWVKVLDFKKEVRGGNRRARGTSQLLDLFELENMKEKREGSHGFPWDTGKCAAVCPLNDQCAGTGLAQYLGNRQEGCEFKLILS